MTPEGEPDVRRCYATTGGPDLPDNGRSGRYGQRGLTVRLSGRQNTVFSHSNIILKFATIIIIEIFKQ
jgi:hypothetical protein